jgi:histidinol-phosphate/aromatic aminotransferase/cobyric acid decarboxylase-like protein
MPDVIRLHTEPRLPDVFPHGGGVLAAARAWGCDAADILDLSTGLHPDGPPPWLGEWLGTHAALVGHYPDGHGEPARSALAGALGVPPEHVRVTAGAQATIEVMFQAMAWRSMAIRTPCYAEPVRCARRSGCRILPFGEGEAAPAAEAVWWTTPANPTGLAEPFPAGRSGAIDESYMPFAERRGLGVMPGVVRIGSLTKSFAIPGLRIGYVVAEVALLERLDHWLPPWPAPTQALHLLPQLLAEADARDAAVAAARCRLETLLKAHGWQMRPSAASFVLARPRDGRQPSFAEARILVRSFPEWPELAGWWRLGLPGSEAEWQRLEAVLCR